MKVILADMTLYHSTLSNIGNLLFSIAAGCRTLNIGRAFFSECDVCVDHASKDTAREKNKHITSLDCISLARPKEIRHSFGVEPANTLQKLAMGGGLLRQNVFQDCRL